MNPYLNTPPTELKRKIKTEKDKSKRKQMQTALNAWRTVVPGPFKKTGAEDMKEASEILKLAKKVLGSRKSKDIVKKLEESGWEGDGWDLESGVTEAVESMRREVEASFKKKKANFGRKQTETKLHGGLGQGLNMAVEITYPQTMSVTWSGDFDMSKYAGKLAKYIDADKKMVADMVRAGDFDAMIEEDFSIPENRYGKSESSNTGRIYKMLELLEKMAWNKGKIETMVIEATYEDEDEMGEVPNTPFIPSYTHNREDFKVSVKNGKIKASMEIVFDYDSSGSRLLFPGQQGYHEYN